MEKLNITELLGIDEEAVTEAFKDCKETLEYVLLDDKIDMFYRSLKTDMWCYLKTNDLTGSIIEGLYSTLCDFIKEFYPEMILSATFKGIDSCLKVYADIIHELTDIKVDRTLIKEILLSGMYHSMDEDIILEVAKDEVAIKSLIHAYSEGDAEEYYESVEALGADNSDNGCREADDTDESFGEFLIRAYRDGCSDTVYIKLSDGRVLTVPIFFE